MGGGDVQKDGPLEISPCVLLDMGSYDPMPKKDLKGLLFQFLSRADGWRDRQRFL